MSHIRVTPDTPLQHGPHVPKLGKDDAAGLMDAIDVCGCSQAISSYGRSDGKIERRERKSRIFTWLRVLETTARYSLELSAYLHRIRFDGSVRPDLATLRAIHRAHQYATPFENIDVLLHRRAVLDLEANYDKIVRQRRGGWCYEMNGVNAAQPIRTSPCAAAFWRLFMRRVSTRSC